MLDKNHIHGLIEQALQGTDFYLVDLTVCRSNLVQVFLDHPKGLSLDDCTKFSALLNDQLDREEEDYELLVSSPGLGQPFKVFRQYLKAIGEKVELTLTSGDRIKGTLIAAGEADENTDGSVVIIPIGTKRKPSSGEPMEVSLKEIVTARIRVDFK